MQEHPITVHVLPGSLRCVPILVALELTKIPAIVKVHSYESIKTQGFKKLNPLGKVPTIETKSGSLFEVGAILRHIADNSDILNCENLRDSAEVDQWFEWVHIDFETIVGHNFLAITGLDGPFMPKLSKKAFEDEVKEWVKQLDVVDKHLKGKEFIVGKKVSIADIILVSYLNFFYKFIFSEKDRKKLPNLTKYFEKLVNSAGFVTVLRSYKESEKEFPKFFNHAVVEEKNAKKAAETKGEKTENKNNKDDKQAKNAESKSQKAPAQKPAEKKVDPKPKKVEEVVEEKKKEPEFPATNFDLHAFKTFFVNEADANKKMEHLWNNFDEKAMSFWHLTYDKLPSECKKLFLTNNLMNGFVDRAAHMRKYLFGVHGVFGEPDNYNIRGIWMGRGTEELPLIKEHDQYDVYKYKKLDHHNESDRKLITEYFTKTAEDVDVLEGEVLRTFTYVL